MPPTRLPRRGAARLDQGARVADAGVGHGDAAGALVVADEAGSEDAVRVGGAVGESAHEDADGVTAADGVLGAALVRAEGGVVATLDARHALAVQALDALPDVLHAAVDRGVAETGPPVAEVRGDDEEGLAVA